MPLSKPYPPTEITYSEWNDLVDSYAGKGATVIVAADGKGDYSTLQEAIDDLPNTNAGEIQVKDGFYAQTRPATVRDREDLIIRGNGKATRFKIADKVQELITIDAPAAQKNVTVADGTTFEVGQLICVRDDTAYEGNEIVSIAGDVITCLNNFVNQYDVADNGRVYTANDVIYVTGTSKRIRITNLLVDGNRLNQEFGRTGLYPAEHHGDGIRLGASTEGCLVDHCFLWSAIAHGVCVAGTRNRILFNEGYDNFYDSINLGPACDMVLAQGNFCHGTPAGGWNGIQIGYSTHDCGQISALGNIIIGGRMGIAGQGGKNCVINNNVLLECIENGIELYSMDRFACEGNLIRGEDGLTDMTGGAIHVEQTCSFGSIVGNIIEQGAGSGIFIEEGALLTVSSNTIRKFVKHGIRWGQTHGRDSVCNSNVIVGADFPNTNTYSGILVEGERLTIMGNRIDNCDKHGIETTVTSVKCIIMGNNVVANAGPFTSGAISILGTGHVLGRARSSRSFHSDGTIAAGATVYLGAHGQDAAEGNVDFRIPYDCTLKNMFVKATGPAGAGESYTYTLRTETADRALTCQIDGAVECEEEDTTNEFAVSEGDTVSIKVVATGGAAVERHSVTIEEMIENGNIT